MINVSRVRRGVQNFEGILNDSEKQHYTLWVGFLKYTVFSEFHTNSSHILSKYSIIVKTHKLNGACKRRGNGAPKIIDDNSNELYLDYFSAKKSVKTI